MSSVTSLLLPLTTLATEEEDGGSNFLVPNARFVDENGNETNEQVPGSKPAITSCARLPFSAQPYSCLAPS